MTSLNRFTSNCDVKANFSWFGNFTIKNENKKAELSNSKILLDKKFPSY